MLTKRSNTLIQLFSERSN